MSSAFNVWHDYVHATLLRTNWLTKKENTFDIWQKNYLWGLHGPLTVRWGLKDISNMPIRCHRVKYVMELHWGFLYSFLMFHMCLLAWMLQSQCLSGTLCTYWCACQTEQRSSNVMQFLWKSFSFALNSFFLNESKATGLFYKLFLLNNKTRNHCTGVKDIKGFIQGIQSLISGCLYCPWSDLTRKKMTPSRNSLNSG